MLGLLMDRRHGVGRDRPLPLRRPPTCPDCWMDRRPGMERNRPRPLRRLRRARIAGWTTATARGGIDHCHSEGFGVGRDRPLPPSRKDHVSSSDLSFALVLLLSPCILRCCIYFACLRTIVLGGYHARCSFVVSQCFAPAQMHLY